MKRIMKANYDSQKNRKKQKQVSKFMKMSLVLVMMIMLGGSGNLWGQKISGIVKNVNDNPVDGVIVYLKSSTAPNFIDPFSRVTGQNGKYSFDISTGSDDFYIWIKPEDCSPDDSMKTTITLNGSDIEHNFVVCDANPPCNLSLSTTQTNATTTDGTDGKIEITATGGTADYTYSWDNGTINGTITKTEANHILDGLSAGFYTLTVIDENECEDIKEVEITAPLPFTLSGTIKANTDPVSKGVVIAYQKNASDVVVAVASTEILLDGTYMFSNLSNGDYYIYAVPEHDLYPTYLPSYFYDKYTWEEKPNPVTINEGNSISINFNLKSFVPGIANGSGEVSGNITFEAGTFETDIYKTKSTKADENAVNLPVLLLDENGNVFDWMLTDADGNYKFENLPFGDYDVVYEKAGYAGVSQSITLSTETPSAKSNLKITNEVLGIFNQVDENLEVSLYPNPVKDILNIEFIANGNYQITILDLNSKAMIVKEGKTNGNTNIKLNTFGLKSGYYIGRLILDGSKTATFKFVK